MRLSLIVATTGRIDYQTASAVTSTILYLKSKGHFIDASMECRESLDMSRNFAFAHFLASKSEVLLLVDEDVIWQDTTHAETLCQNAIDLDSIVGAVVPDMRQDYIKTERPQRSGLGKAHYVGAGFTAYSRGAVERIVLSEKKANGIYPIFATTINEKEFVHSEWRPCLLHGGCYINFDIRTQRRMVRNMVTSINHLMEDEMFWPKTTKPRVLLAIDRHGWSIGNVAQQIQEHLSDEFCIQIAPYNELSFGECDLFVGLWWGDMLAGLNKIKSAQKIIAIYDAFSWAYTDLSYEQLISTINDSDIVVAANDAFLKRLIEKGAIKNKPTAVCEDGVDLDLFTPQPFSGVFTVGWVGNSKLSNSVSCEDYKGLNYIKKACEAANVPLIVQDTANGGCEIVHEDMPDWYSKISCLMIGSVEEGTPNPLLEAAACSRPIISTRVGLAPQLLAHGGGILVDRNIEQMAEAIKKIKDTNYETIGKQARVAVEAFSWKNKVEEWRRVFKQVLNG